VVGDAYVPARGDIVWLDFEPSVGREQTGYRPALVVSPEAFNRRTGLALLCPVTSRLKGYPFEVRLPDSGPISGVILADHIKSLDWRERGARPVGRAPIRIVGEVLDKVRVLLGS